MSSEQMNGKGASSNGSVKSAAVERSLAKLEHTYTALYRALFARALRVVRSKETAEDILQQAYINSMQAIIRGSEVENYRAWLNTVVHRLSVAQKRAQAAAMPEGDLVSVDPKSTADAFRSRHHLREVYKTVRTLPAPQGVAFLMHEFHGATDREIAKTLDRSEIAVRGLLTRARKTVRSKIDLDVFGLGGPPSVATTQLASDTSLSAKLSQLKTSCYSFLHNCESLISRAVSPTYPVVASVVVATALTGLPNRDGIETPVRIDIPANPMQIEGPEIIQEADAEPSKPRTAPPGAQILPTMKSETSRQLTDSRSLHEDTEPGSVVGHLSKIDPPRDTLTGGPEGPGERTPDVGAPEQPPPVSNEELINGAACYRASIELIDGPRIERPLPGDESADSAGTQTVDGTQAEGQTRAPPKTSDPPEVEDLDGRDCESSEGLSGLGTVG